MYPHQPATGKTDTSAEAAEAIRPSVSQLQYMIIGRLAMGGPQTSYELSDTLGENHANTQPRCTELKALGLIRDSGLRGTTPNSSRRCIKWELIPQ